MKLMFLGRVVNCLTISRKKKKKKEALSPVWLNRKRDFLSPSYKAQQWPIYRVKMASCYFFGQSFSQVKLLKFVAFSEVLCLKKELYEKAITKICGFFNWFVSQGSLLISTWIQITLFFRILMYLGSYLFLESHSLFMILAVSVIFPWF